MKKSKCSLKTRPGWCGVSRRTGIVNRIRVKTHRSPAPRRTSRRGLRHRPLPSDGGGDHLIEQALGVLSAAELGARFITAAPPGDAEANASRSGRRGTTRERFPPPGCRRRRRCSKPARPARSTAPAPTASSKGSAEPSDRRASRRPSPEPPARLAQTRLVGARGSIHTWNPGDWACRGRARLGRSGKRRPESPGTSAPCGPAPTPPGARRNPRRARRRLPLTTRKAGTGPRRQRFDANHSPAADVGPGGRTTTAAHFLPSKTFKFSRVQRRSAPAGAPDALTGKRNVARDVPPALPRERSDGLAPELPDRPRDVDTSAARLVAGALPQVASLRSRKDARTRVEHRQRIHRHRRDRTGAPGTADYKLLPAARRSRPPSPATPRRKPPGWCAPPPNDLEGGLGPLLGRLTQTCSAAGRGALVVLEGLATESESTGLDLDARPLDAAVAGLDLSAKPLIDEQPREPPWCRRMKPSKKRTIRGSDWQFFVALSFGSPPSTALSSRALPVSSAASSSNPRTSSSLVDRRRRRSGPPPERLPGSQADQPRPPAPRAARPPTALRITAMIPRPFLARRRIAALSVEPSRRRRRSDQRSGTTTAVADRLSRNSPAGARVAEFASLHSRDLGRRDVQLLDEMPIETRDPRSQSRPSRPGWTGTPSLRTRTRRAETRARQPLQVPQRRPGQGEHENVRTACAARRRAARRRPASLRSKERSGFARVNVSARRSDHEEGQRLTARRRLVTLPRTHASITPSPSFRPHQADRVRRASANELATGCATRGSRSRD